jgi:pimeloyl-ACP methyl ester carboxylesterase
MVPDTNKLRRLAKRVAKGLLILALLILVCASCSADRIILGENHKPVDAHGARRGILHVQGRNIECWTARSAAARSSEPVALVLYFVGRGDRADRWTAAVAGAWDKLPVEVWGVNYPASGGSDGPPSLVRVGENAVAAFDEVRHRFGSRPIFVEGGSFGTTAALCVAARRPVAGVVLQNPPPLRQLILGHYGWWNLWLVAGPVALQIPHNLDSVDNAAHSRAPAVFILADGDEMIPPAYHEKIVSAYAGDKRIIHIPGARHADGLPREAAEQLAQDRQWLWDKADHGK